MWFAQCAEIDIPYSTIEADAQFDMNYIAMTRAAKGHNKGEVQIEEVPVTITVGVTIALCGLFLYFVPNFDKLKRNSVIIELIAENLI